ncbi:MAG: hypothetical protein K6348_00070 [Deferribacterales bacterium]
MDNALLKLIEQLKLNYSENYTGDPIVAYPHFNNNYGFFDLHYKNNRVALLKSVHKDFIRVIQGEMWLDERSYSKISEYLSDIEKNCDNFIDISFYLDDDTIYITGLNLDYKPNTLKPDVKVPYPLTKVEYNLSQTDGVKEKTLWGKSPLNTILPENPTNLACGIIKKLPDILNPMFEYVNLRTQSPSLKLIFNKPFVNMKNLFTWSNTLESNEYLIYINYIQHMLIKERKNKIPSLDIKLLDIKKTEIEEALNEIESTLINIDETFLLSNRLYEYISLQVMTAEMIQVHLLKYFTELYKITQELDLTLKMIFQTRNGSLFYNTFKFPDYFDFDSEILEVKPIDFAPVKTDIFINQLPLVKKLINKGKIIDILGNLHEYLDFRDRLFQSSIQSLLTLKKVIMAIGEKLKENMQIKNINDILSLEIDEINQILNNSFYGNIGFNIYFRKTQRERFKIQKTPPEIFEKDIPNSEEVSNKIVEKLKNSNFINCIILFYKDDIKKLYPTYHPRLSNITNLDNYDGIIIENLPLFSHLMEYLVLTEKTICTGVRFPPEIVSNKIIKIEKDGLRIE